MIRPYFPLSLPYLSYFPCFHQVFHQSELELCTSQSFHFWELERMPPLFYVWLWWLDIWIKLSPYPNITLMFVCHLLIELCDLTLSKQVSFFLTNGQSLKNDKCGRGEKILHTESIRFSSASIYNLRECHVWLIHQLIPKKKRTSRKGQSKQIPKRKIQNGLHVANKLAFTPARDFVFFFLFRGRYVTPPFFRIVETLVYEPNQSLRYDVCEKTPASIKPRRALTSQRKSKPWY